VTVAQRLPVLSGQPPPHAAIALKRRGCHGKARRLLAGLRVGAVLARGAGGAGHRCADRLHRPHERRRIGGHGHGQRARIVPEPGGQLPSAQVHPERRVFPHAWYDRRGSLHAHLGDRDLHLRTSMRRLVRPLCRATGEFGRHLRVLQLRRVHDHDHRASHRLRGSRLGARGERPAVDHASRVQLHGSGSRLRRVAGGVGQERLALRRTGDDLGQFHGAQGRHP
jgi:hypothetical protein